MLLLGTLVILFIGYNQSSFSCSIFFSFFLLVPLIYIFLYYTVGCSPLNAVPTASIVSTCEPETNSSDVQYENAWPIKQFVAYMYMNSAELVIVNTLLQNQTHDAPCSWNFNESSPLDQSEFRSQ